MKKPVLVIMAAGLGSRYGGLKQIDPIDGKGHIIMDFSIYDAKRAGFEKVVFIIKEENEKDFKDAIGNRVSKEMEVVYAYQDIQDIPIGYKVPEGRVKPWGTAHAVFSSRKHVDGAFAVINADDYYGPEAFQKIFDFLTQTRDTEIYQYTMVGYDLEKTITENGYVSRGICTLSEEQELVEIIERTHIEKRGEEIAYTLDEEKTWNVLPKDTVVSMNMWGFTGSMMAEIEKKFPVFLDKSAKENPLKGEYYLPGVVSDLLEEKKAAVKVLHSKDKWYGVTYQEDKVEVTQVIERMKEAGLYPKGELWR